MSEEELFAYQSAIDMIDIKFSSPDRKEAEESLYGRAPE